MSDKRHDRVANADKELLRRRQSQTVVGSPDHRGDVESKRRDDEEEAIVEAAPKKSAQPTPPETSTPTQVRPRVETDRWHKKSLSHITVSKKDFDDSVPQASRFDNVNDAIQYAINVVTPKLTDPTKERIIIEIHGGDYEENITIPADCIDLQGIGFPTIRGAHSIVPGINGPSNRINLIDIEMVNSNAAVAFPALTIQPLTDYPAAPPAQVVIDRCFIHGKNGGLEARGSRLKARRSRFYTDFMNVDYDNIDVPAVKLWQHINGYTVFDGECELRGVIDKRTPSGAVGFPNVGRALEMGTLFPSGIPSVWPGTGVMIRRSSVTGYVINTCWNLIFAHCDNYGGRKHATAGDVFCFLIGDSATNVHAAVTFDHTSVACRYIVEALDMTTPPANGITDVYIQHFKQLGYGGLTGGSTVESGVVFGDLGYWPTYGNVYVEHSATWRDLWDFIPGAPPNEGAVIFTSNPDVALAIPAVLAAALPSDFRQDG